MEEVPYLVGQVLLAMPGIADRRFAGATVAMCAHDADGAMGVGVGALIDGIRLHDLLKQLDIDPGQAPDVPVHFGGPVEPRRGFVLHDTGWNGQDTVDVAGRWSVSGTVDVLRAIADGTGPERFVVALGYAGWSAGQLEAEMTRHGWLNVEGDADFLFDTATDARWTAGYARAGIDPRLFSPGAGTA